MPIQRLGTPEAIAKVASDGNLMHIDVGGLGRGLKAGRPGRPYPATRSGTATTPRSSASAPLLFAAADRSAQRSPRRCL
jgi:hypothetical protein